MKSEPNFVIIKLAEDSKLEYKRKLGGNGSICRLKKFNLGVLKRIVKFQAICIDSLWHTLRLENSFKGHFQAQMTDLIKKRLVT